MIKTEIIEALIPLKDPALISMLAYFAEIHHYKKNESICFGAVFYGVILLMNYRQTLRTVL